MNMLLLVGSIFAFSQPYSGEKLSRGLIGKMCIRDRIYFIEMATGKIIQATEGPNLGSAFLANKTNRMFVSRKGKKKLEHVCDGLG